MIRRQDRETYRCVTCERYIHDAESRRGGSVG